MKFSYLFLLCCLALLQACSFPKIASKNAVITTGNACCHQEPPAIVPRLLSAPPPIRSLSVQAAPISMQPTISETILFPTNQYHLSQLAEKLITDFANQVRDDNDQIMIEGYTDSQYNLKYNQRLSKKRAISVRDALLARGIDAQRLTINAFGETAPAASNKTLVGRQKNRRVVIKVVQPNASTNTYSQFTSPRIQ